MLSDRANFWRNIRNFAMRPERVSAPEALTAETADDFNRVFASVGERIATELREAGGEGEALSPRPPRVTSAGLVLQPVTLPNLSESLRELSSARAVGVDGIPLFAIRNCFAVIAPHLLHLINVSIVTRVFPSAWKTASVVPIHKSGPRDSASNFRPISILPALSKLCEKVVCTQLSVFLAKHYLFSPSQYAYRSCHSTEDAVMDAISARTNYPRCSILFHSQFLENES